MPYFYRIISIIEDMKRFILNIFAFMLVSFGAIAQVEVTSGSIILETQGSEQIFQEITIMNNSDESMELYWIYEPADDYPENWRTQLCDLNLCYDWNSFNSSAVLPNVIESGQEVTFTIKVKHITEGMFISGSSCGILRLFDDPDKTNEVTATVCTTSTDELEADDLVIYPNPTSESFQLKNDDAVSTISIYNIVGRLVKTVNHSQGMVHDVTTLRTGMYLVRLENKNGDVLKSMRLSKR